MEISPNVLDRITKAADEIYAEAGRSGCPTVDAVRKRARVNMNDASSGMKIWRLAQTATCNPMPAQLPPSLQASCISSVNSLWIEATNIANESLRAAQAGWEAERANAEVLSKEMAAAFDAQTSELDEAQVAIAKLQAQLEAANSHAAAMRSARELAERDRAAATAAATEAAAKALEIERRADELQKAVAHARQETSIVRADMTALQSAQAEQLERVRGEARNDLANERARLERDRERYHESETKAIAEAARLKGRLEAMESLYPAKSAARQPRPKPKPDGAAKGDGSASSKGTPVEKKEPRKGDGRDS
jgi:colicin import membrane protein